jgi:hypothetical protein
MKFSIVLVLSIWLGIAPNDQVSKNYASPDYNKSDREQKVNTVEGSWKVIDFTYLKAGTKRPMELGRADFEDLVKHEATYTFDKSKGLILSMGAYTRIFGYIISNNRLNITEKEGSRILNSYTFRIDSNKMTLIENTDSYDLTLTFEKVN